MSDKKYVGSIEAGGTKVIVAVQDVETGKEVARDRIPTTPVRKPWKRMQSSLRSIQLMH